MEVPELRVKQVRCERVWTKGAEKYTTMAFTLHLNFSKLLYFLDLEILSQVRFGEVGSSGQ
jgi:hypothetical protein